MTGKLIKSVQWFSTLLHKVCLPALTQTEKPVANQLFWFPSFQVYKYKVLLNDMLCTKKGLFLLMKTYFNDFSLHERHKPLQNIKINFPEQSSNIEFQSVPQHVQTLQQRVHIWSGQYRQRLCGLPCPAVFLAWGQPTGCLAGSQVSARPVLAMFTRCTIPSGEHTAAGTSRVQQTHWPSARNMLDDA